MRVWEGWRFAILTTVLIAILSAAYLIQGGFDEPSVLGAIRTTARTSGILFFLAFAAPGIRWGGARRWFERNASSLLLAFAGSHLVHFLLLVTWVALFPHSLFEELSIPFVAVHLVLYGVILMLALTALRSIRGSSFQLNGRESAGMYLLWAVFTFAFGARALAGPLYPVLAVMSVASLVLRLGSRKRRNQILGEAG